VTTYHVSAAVHGTVLDEGPASAACCLLGFHGYGGSAATMLRYLDRVPLDNARRVSVQALHPFYQTDGSVGYSWMTSADRETAIGANLAYSGAVLDRCLGHEQVVLVGFSQGAAMAYRLAVARREAVAGLIVLGGDVPPELRAGAASSLPPTLVGRGDRDERYPASRHQADVALLARAGVAVRAGAFAGGHHWGRGFTPLVAAFLGQLSR
jgi:phospholipase/carboxylesterase